MRNRQRSRCVYRKLGGWWLLRHGRVGHLLRRPSRRLRLCLRIEYEKAEQQCQERRTCVPWPHERTASPPGATAASAVSPTSQPSCNWMTREPYDALTSECVTCTMVVPS